MLNTFLKYACSNFSISSYVTIFNQPYGVPEMFNLSKNYEGLSVMVLIIASNQFMQSNIETDCKINFAEFPMGYNYWLESFKTPYLPQHKKIIFVLRISSVMWPNPLEDVDLVIFTEEIVSGKLHFLCSVQL